MARGKKQGRSIVQKPAARYKSRQCRLLFQLMSRRKVVTTDFLSSRCTKNRPRHLCVWFFVATPWYSNLATVASETDLTPISTKNFTANASMEDIYDVID